MKVTFVNPGVEYMIKQIMEFQTENESDFWMAPLYHFYPELKKDYAMNLPYPERKKYIEQMMRTIYARAEETINNKVCLYTKHWEKCSAQITEALSEAFDMDCASEFNDLQCNVSINPIMPRFLKERQFDLFYLNSEKGAIGDAIHEIIHFVWFFVWNRLYKDSYDEYERPSLKWILSEMAVEPVMRDPRLSTINPYFPRENGGCIYPYFFDMKADGKYVLETLNEMYRSQHIEEFMCSSYDYCKKHEAEIRAHILKSEEL